MESVREKLAEKLADEGLSDLSTLLQQSWFCLLELEEFFLDERKKASIPGSIRKDEPLFKPDDLKVDLERQRVNRAGLAHLL